MMTSEEFVRDLKSDVKDCVEATIECLSSPPSIGGVAEKFSPLPNWLQNLSERDKRMVRLAMEYASKEVLFNLLAVIDGVNYLPSKDEGHFELYYVKDGEKVLLNNPSNKSLYELFGHS